MLVFTNDHVKEDGYCGPPQLLLWDQSHLQDGTHHARDETDLMAACKINLHFFKGKNVTSSTHELKFDHRNCFTMLKYLNFDTVVLFKYVNSKCLYCVFSINMLLFICCYRFFFILKYFLRLLNCTILMASLIPFICPLWG